MPTTAHPTCDVRDTVRAGELEVDRTPVTNARYATFVAATGHRTPLYWPKTGCPAGLRDHPVVGVDFLDAVAFAVWAGGALPTEAEWLAAAGLEEARPYLWGADFEGDRCNTVRSELRGTSPVGRFPRGDAPSGCVDLCGNVWEMTCDAFDDDEESVLVKGGSWYDFPVHARLDARFRARVDKAGTTVGFRLVYGRHVSFPEFLTPESVAERIAQRQLPPDAAPAAEEAPVEYGGEFADIVEELREGAHFEPDLLDLRPAIGFDDEALDFFDRIDLTLAEEIELKATPVRSTEPTLIERMHSVVETHPHLLRAGMAAAVMLVALLLWSAARAPDAGARGTPDRSLADATPTTTHRKAVAPAETGATTRKPRPPKKKKATPKLTGIAGALHDLAHGKPGARDEAERFLIQFRDELKPQLRQALADSDSGRVRASLRYILAARQELRTPPQHMPELLRSPPEEGLLFFFRRMDGSVSDEIAMVRRTAKAEGLKVTVVFSGEAAGAAVANTYANLLRNVDFYSDHDGELSRRLGAEKTPAVAGLRRGGRLAFLHVGPVPRSRLAAKAASLRG